MEPFKVIMDKLAFLKDQTYFVASRKHSFLIALILGVCLSFIIIFLEPFDTNEFESSNRYILLLGFGGLFSLVYVVQSVFESYWYRRVHKVWSILTECIAMCVFFILAGTVIYLYNRFVINGLEYSFSSHIWYFTHIVSVMLPIFMPLFLFLRRKFGERIIPLGPDKTIIEGRNKHEILEIELTSLIYIKATENYIDIFYIDEQKQLVSKTFRQTLSNAHTELPFLVKCHRSYLVNIDKIKDIEGNSQNAKISFIDTDKKIPLSKSFYSDIKSKFQLAST